METRVNYTLVGLFVIILGMAIIGGVLWLTTGQEQAETYAYRVYTTDSVAGLNVNAAVRYKGVAVGKVLNIGLDPENPERVAITLEVGQTTPIREGTTAKLVSQGITGLVNIELSGGAGTPSLEPTLDNPVPVLESAPSLVTQVTDTFQQISVALNRLLAAENIEALNATLNNIESMSANLAEENNSLQRNLRNLEVFTTALANNTGQLERILEGTAQTLEQTVALEQQVQPLIGQTSNALQSFETMTETIVATTQEVSRTVASGREQIEQLGRTTGPQLNQVLNQLSQLTATLQRFTQQLERNPPALLRGRSSVRPGPGE